MKLSDDMQEELENAVQKALTNIFEESHFSKTEVIQNLWSGYGEIARYSQDRGENSVIVKMVDPTAGSHHPRGWNTNTSHQRKLSSYVNEQHFYRYYAGSTNGHCRVPDCLAYNTETGVNFLVMEDLDRAGFDERREHASSKIVERGLEWLAHFHAIFAQSEGEHLWSIGTYWHLKTRPDEWRRMESGALKTHAKNIDQILNGANYQTLVHGDAKLANFCFDGSFERLAAVDFQYVGRGVGIKDVVYFLGSCLSEQALFEQADNLLDHYFSELAEALGQYQASVNATELEQEWRYLLPFAWADFERFLVGWAPEHFKRHRYSIMQTEKALDLI